MGERSVAYTTLKMAVLAPMPRMRARRATDVKPRFLRSSRRPKRTLRTKLFMPLPPDDHSLEWLDVFVGPFVAGSCEILAIFVELAGQGPRCCEAPGGFERAAQGGLSSRLQAYVRGATASPDASAGVEDRGLGFNKHLLFDRCEFDHGPAILRVAECGEDLSADAKVRMVHVDALFSFWKAEGQAAKVVGGHLGPPRLAIVPEFLDESFKMRAPSGVCSSAKARQNSEIETNASRGRPEKGQV